MPTKSSGIRHCRRYRTVHARWRTRDHQVMSPHAPSALHHSFNLDDFRSRSAAGPLVGSSRNWAGCQDTGRRPRHFPSTHLGNPPGIYTALLGRDNILTAVRDVGRADQDAQCPASVSFDSQKKVTRKLNGDGQTTARNFGTVNCCPWFDAKFKATDVCD